MPQLAKIIGTIWATRKHEDLDGATMRLIQPINSRGSAVGQSLVAVDTVGAGLGETVLYITSYEAVIPYPKDLVPIDASIVGVVDKIYPQESSTP